MLTSGFSESCLLSLQPFITNNNKEKKKITVHATHLQVAKTSYHKFELK